MTDSMTTTFDKKIDIVVQSKYPKILEKFMETFLPTTSEFKNLNLYTITGESYGAKEINKILIPAIKAGSEVFGVFNDDLTFSKGWLDDALDSLEDYEAVSCGYVETEDMGKFEKAVEATKNETGVVEFLYGPNALFRSSIFKRIGIFDERFDWSCDDIDLALRIKLHGMRSVTLKKVTVAHAIGSTRGNTSKKWNTIWETNKQRFYDKHGYVSYRDMRTAYKGHKYFQQFR